jgi:diguanylate cyclase (GGDEF)-like protein/PAS domain S-box-containing protein
VQEEPVVALGARATIDARASLLDVGPVDLAVAIVETAHDAILAKTLDGTVVSWNQAAEELYGYTAEEMIGAPVATIVPDDLRAELTGLLACVEQGERIVDFETLRRRKDGTIVEVSITISPILDASGVVVGASTIARDATERARLMRLTEHRALHDPLTDLANRAFALEQLRLALARSERRGSWVAVLFVDLDRFKGVNDRHGHLFGDAVLRIAAHRIRTAVRTADTVARFGGDEFIVICADLDNPSEAKAVIDRVADAMALPFDFAETDEVHVGASIGLRVSAGGEDPMAVIRDADEAMYREKVRRRKRMRRP